MRRISRRGERRARKCRCGCRAPPGLPERLRAVRLWIEPTHPGNATLPHTHPSVPLRPKWNTRRRAREKSEIANIANPPATTSTQATLQKTPTARMARSAITISPAGNRLRPVDRVFITYLSRQVMRALFKS